MDKVVVAAGLPPEPGKTGLARPWINPPPRAVAGWGARVAALKHHQLPTLRGDVVPQDVDTAVVTLELEVPMVGSQPTVENLHDLDPSSAEQQPSGSLLGHVA